MDFMPDIIGGDEEPNVTEEIHDEEVTVPDLNQEDVFDIPIKDPPISTVNANGTEATKPVEDNKKDQKVVKTRKKRVMTQEQKDKLAVARKKALEVRREKARLKKEEKELLKLKKEQELDQLRQSVKPKKDEEPIKKEPVKIQKEDVDIDKEAQINPSNNGFSNYKYTQEDVDRISLNAVQNYDKVRKSRKADKLKKQKEEAQKEAERQKLLSMVTNKPVKQDDYWGNCF